MYGKTAQRQIKETVRRTLVNPKEGRQSVPGLDFSQRLDNERVKNTSGEEIPAFGIMEIVDWSNGVDGYFVVTKPTGDPDAIGYLLNGREAIADNGLGSGSWINVRPLPALIDATAMSLNDECGPTAGSWELSADGHGFRLISEEIGDTPQRAFIYKPFKCPRAVHEIEFKEASSGGGRGWYVDYTDDIGTWVLKIPVVLGYCSSGSSGSSGCSTDGYDPGSGWFATTVSGYSAAWTNSSAVSAPADPPVGSWLDTSYTDGGYVHKEWRNLECNWIATGASFVLPG